MGTGGELGSSCKVGEDGKEIIVRIYCMIKENIFDKRKITKKLFL